MATSIRMLSGALDESPLRGGSIILRGVVHADDVDQLKVDNYQREVLPITERSSLLKALKAGQPLPDIELGMRGQRYTTRADVHFLQDDVYIIDGLQRVSAIRHFLQIQAAPVVRLGCVLHFDTSREWERERFHVLNAYRSRMSPNVLLRNSREEHRITDFLYTLTTETTNFPLYKRVQWGQRATREELITAKQLLLTTAYLHSHRIRGMIGANLYQMVEGGDKLLDLFGSNAARQNLMTFYRLINTAWGLENIKYRELAPQLKGTFGYMLAKLLADHHDFWRNGERQLFIDVDQARKFSSFKLQDPNIMGLAASTGSSRKLLYDMIADHYNSGRRTGRLRKRQDALPVADKDNTNEDVAA